MVGPPGFHLVAVRKAEQSKGIARLSKPPHDAPIPNSVSALIKACAAFSGIGLASGFTGVAASVAVLTAGEVIFAPALSDMAAHLGDSRRLGRAFGLFGLMQQLGLSMGPLVGGTLYDHLRHMHFVMWGTIAGGMAIIGLGYIAFGRRHGFGWKKA